MVAIAPVVSRKGTWLIATWSSVTENDTFSPMYLNHNVSDMFIEFGGTHGGATVTLNGYSETSAYTVALVDPGGTAISLVNGGVRASAIRDAWPYMQPAHSGGSSESADVTIKFKIVQ